MNRRYQARARRPGARKYSLIGEPRDSYNAAIMDLAKAFARSMWKRGDVIMWEDYYDPQVLVEMVRR